jgi:hypothetical protein
MGFEAPVAVETSSAGPRSADASYRVTASTEPGDGPAAALDEKRES